MPADWFTGADEGHLRGQGASEMNAATEQTNGSDQADHLRQIVHLVRHAVPVPTEAEKAAFDQANCAEGFDGLG